MAIVKIRAILCGLALLLCGVLFHAHAQADTGLAIVCSDTSQSGQLVYSNACGASSQTGQVYAMPKAGDLVRTAASGVAHGADYAWIDWAKLPGGGFYEVCSTDVPVGSPIAGGSCAAWSMVAKPAAATSNGTIALTWQPPTTNTDGTSLTDLAGFNLYRAGDAAPIQTFSDPKATGTTVNGLAPGSYSFDLTAFNAAGVESARTTSVAAPAVLPAPAIPSPPVNFRVVAPTAYDLVKGTDTLAAKAIGTVPIGTACNLKVQALGLYGVPRSKVALVGTTTRPQVVLANCGG